MTWLAPGPLIFEQSKPDPEEPKAIDRLGRSVVHTLGRHGAVVTLVKTVRGPTVVRFDVTLGTRTKVGHVKALRRDIAAAIGGEVRLVEHLDQRAGMAVEVPNPRRRPVLLGDVLRRPMMGWSKGLRVVVGLDAGGKPLQCDLTELPHLLVGGTTGGGKSTLLHSMIACLLAEKTPRDLRLLLVDPKRVELTRWDGFPHLLCPTVKDVTKALEAFDLILAEVEERYQEMERMGCTSLAEVREKGARWPYVLVVVDELADLMMVGSKALETTIVRIAQKARAVGVHLVLATQRPSVDVVTGLIKGNVPGRIALRTTDWVNSKIILDAVGAQNLLGKGDLLMVRDGLVRAQSAMVTDGDMERLRSYWGRQVERKAA